MSSGNIVEIIGAVVDVEFPRDAVPKVYDALLVGDAGLTLEVQQQLGDGIVRTIAMGSSEAAGYVEPEGGITTWLNELAFAPVDYTPQAPADEWSGDRGCAAAERASFGRSPPRSRDRRSAPASAPSAGSPTAPPRADRPPYPVP